jgi:putative hydrolase of the HAD superfamily
VPPKLKAVLFDIDDTLFDREKAQKLALKLTVEKHPALLGRIAPEILQQAWDQSDNLATLEFNAGAFARVTRSRHFLRLLNLPLDQVPELTEQYLKDYTSLNVPVAGAPELVRELFTKTKVGVISNSLADVQYGKLKTLGLTGYLSCIVLSEELGIRKPDPRIFLHAACLLHVQASECLFVGDSWATDIAGAKAAGMLAVWLKRQDIPPLESPPSPDYIIQALTELIPLLKRDRLISG